MNTQVFDNFYKSLVGSFGDQLPSVLATLLILIVGIFIAKTIRGVIVKYLRGAGWLTTLAGDTDKAGIANTFGALVYYLILLNVLLIVLARMNIQSVLDPLKDLAGQFMSALPRVIGAAIIFYVGWVIAKLVSTFVGIATKKVDELIGAKGLDLPFKISKFLSAFVLIVILLPMAVAGFEFLAINAISEPAVRMITELISTVPNIIGAGLILLVSYIVGKFVVLMLSQLLEGMNANILPAKMGLPNLFTEQRTFVQFVGSVVMFFIMLTAMIAAIDKLNISIVSAVFVNILEFGGGLVASVVILAVGTLLANIAYDKIIGYQGNKVLAGICRIAIFGLVLAMSLRTIGLADNIVNMAFAFTFGGVSVAIAIAFGWGGREAAQSITNEWAKEFLSRKK